MIVSFSDESCTVRFHKIRESESWICDDLEQYSLEAVCVFETNATPVLT